MQNNVTVDLRQEAGYRFAVQFSPDIPVLVSDEPAPLGQGAGPSPVQLLVAAVGNCLADSLLFALKKFKQSPEPIRASAEAVVGRNEQNRLRVQRVSVRLTLGTPRTRCSTWTRPSPSSRNSAPSRRACGRLFP